MTKTRQDAQVPAERRETPQRRTYEPPRLTAYGSLAKLTRTGVGTLREAGMGPSSRFQ